MTTYSKPESNRLVRESRNLPVPSPWIELPDMADQLAAATERIEQLERENGAHRALAMLEPKEMSYEQRSEFERLKRADVDQGKRIAELLCLNERLQEQWLEVHREDRPVRTENRLLKAKIAEATEQIERLCLRPPMACSACEDHNLAICDENRRLQYENDELRKVISEDKAVLLAEHRELRAQMHEVLDALVFAGEKVDMNLLFNSKDAGARTEALADEARRLRVVWKIARDYVLGNREDDLAVVSIEERLRRKEALDAAVDAALEAEKAK